MIFRISNLVFLLLFVLSAIVQYNDPDPIQWILVYSLAALACLLYIFKKLPRWYPLSLGLISFVWSILLFVESTGLHQDLSIEQVFVFTEMKTLMVELAREISGLLLVTFWMIMLLVWLTRGRKGV